MWNEDILNSVLEYLPLQPFVVDAVRHINPVLWSLVEDRPTIPRCIVSVDGGDILALPILDDDRPFKSLERSIIVDGMGTLCGKEPLEKLLRDSRALRHWKGIPTSVTILRLEHCRRFLPQHLPKQFISDLCVGSLTVLEIAGYPSNAIDQLVQGIVIACGDTLRRISIANDTYVSPSTVGQVSVRCNSLETLALPTSNSFVAVAVSSLLELHPLLHRLTWWGSAMTILPAMARYAKGLRQFGSDDLMWRSREQLPLIKLVISANINSIIEIKVDSAGANTSDSGRYLASIMLTDKQSPSALALRLKSLSYQESQGLAQGNSSLKYFAHCASLTELDVSIDTLESLPLFSRLIRLNRTRIRTGPAHLPADRLQSGRDTLVSTLVAHAATLERLELYGHAAYPELLGLCSSSWFNLRHLVLDLRSIEHAEPSNDAFTFMDGSIAGLVAHTPLIEYLEITSHITDAAVGHIVASCARLETLVLSGRLTDAGLGHLYDPCPPAQRLYSIKSLSFGGPTARFTFEVACQLVKALGHHMTSLGLSSLYEAVADQSEQPNFGDLLMACANYCPLLRSLAISGNTNNIPSDTLSAFKKGCRMAKLDLL